MSDKNKVNMIKPSIGHVSAGVIPPKLVQKGATPSKVVPKTPLKKG